jgi:hypothetical protein
MSKIKKIQPKANIDIDLDMLTQKIKAQKEAAILEEMIPDSKKEKKAKPIAKVAKTPEKTQKKRGRKKTNTEAMHRFAIDLPEWLFEQIRNDANDNFSTVRGQIMKVLLTHYKT